MSELMNMSENKDSHIHRLEEMMPVTVPQFVVNEYNQMKLENIALKARVAELEEKLYGRFDEQADMEAGQ